MLVLISTFYAPDLLRLIVSNGIELPYLKALFYHTEVAILSTCIDSINLRSAFSTQISNLQISQRTILLYRIGGLKHLARGCVIELDKVILSHLRVSVKGFAFTADYHVESMILPLSCTKQISILSESHWGKRGHCVEILDFKADDFLALFSVPQ